MAIHSRLGHTFISWGFYAPLKSSVDVTNAYACICQITGVGIVARAWWKVQYTYCTNCTAIKLLMLLWPVEQELSGVVKLGYIFGAETT